VLLLDLLAFEKALRVANANILDCGFQYYGTSLDVMDLSAQRTILYQSNCLMYAC